MSRTEILDPREAAEAEALFNKAAGGELARYSPDNTVAANLVNQVISAPRAVRDRDLAKVMRDIKTMAAMAGEDWYYRFPVRNKDGQDWIEGPSIKCAENVARLYGNCDVACFSMDQGTSWLFMARFVDLETGFSLIRPFQADKAKVTVKTKDPGRQQEIAYAIGASKATRNVITNAIETFTNFAVEEAKKNLVEKVGKKLDEYRKRVVDRLTSLEIDVKRVEAVRGRKVEEWLAPDVALIIAELKAIADGMATADETWPPPPPPEPKRGDFKEEAKKADAEKKSDPGHDPSTGEIKETAAAAAEGQAAAKTEEKEPEAEKPTRSPWALADDIVGQENRLKAVLELLELAKTKSDVDEIREEHAEFLSKLGRNRAATLRRFDERTIELPERLEEDS